MMEKTENLPEGEKEVMLQLPNSYFEKGKQEGIEEGKLEGIEEGMKKGIEKEKQEVVFKIDRKRYAYQ